MKKGTRTTIAILLGASVLLTGCTSAPEAVKPEQKPSSTSTPTPTTVPTETTVPSDTIKTPPPNTNPKPTPQPLPSIPPTKPVEPYKPAPTKTTVIEIGADEVRIENLKGEVKQKFIYETYEDLNPAIAYFTKMYGKEPVKTYSGDEDVCWYQMNSYTWDNVSIQFSKNVTADSDQEPAFFVSTQNVNPNYERVVQAPNGAQIGFSYKKLIEANPELPQGEVYKEFAEFNHMLGEVSKKDTGDEPYGTLINAMKDKVTFIGAPQFLERGGC